MLKLAWFQPYLHTLNPFLDNVNREKIIKMHETYINYVLRIREVIFVMLFISFART